MTWDVSEELIFRMAKRCEVWAPAGRWHRDYAVHGLAPEDGLTGLVPVVAPPWPRPLSLPAPTSSPGHCASQPRSCGSAPVFRGTCGAPGDGLAPPVEGDVAFWMDEGPQATAIQHRHARVTRVVEAQRRTPYVGGEVPPSFLAVTLAAVMPFPRSRTVRVTRPVQALWPPLRNETV